MESKDKIACRMALALSMAVSSALLSTVANAQLNPYFKTSPYLEGSSGSVRVSPNINNKVERLKESGIDMNKEPFARFPDHFKQNGPFTRFSHTNPVDRVINPGRAGEVYQQIQQ